MTNVCTTDSPITGLRQLETERGGILYDDVFGRSVRSCMHALRRKSKVNVASVRLHEKEKSPPGNVPSYVSWTLKGIGKCRPTQMQPDKDREG